MKRIVCPPFMMFVILFLTAPALVSITNDAPASHLPHSTKSMSKRQDGLEKIQHFVFIMQENRSFDSYFGTYPGADGIPEGICLHDPTGAPCVAPYHDTNVVNRGGPHSWDNHFGCLNSG